MAEITIIIDHVLCSMTDSYAGFVLVGIIKFLLPFLCLLLPFIINIAHREKKCVVLLLFGVLKQHIGVLFESLAH